MGVPIQIGEKEIISRACLLFTSATLLHSYFHSYFHNNNEKEQQDPFSLMNLRRGKMKIWKSMTMKFFLNKCSGRWGKKKQ